MKTNLKTKVTQKYNFHSYGNGGRLRGVTDIFQMSNSNGCEDLSVYQAGHRSEKLSRMKLLLCYFDQHTFDTKQDDLYCIDDYETRTKNMNKHHVRSKIVLLHKITHNHFLTGSLLASGETFLLTVADICQTIKLPTWICLFILL